MLCGLRGPRPPFEGHDDDPSFALADERLAFTDMIEGREPDAWREAMSLPDCASEPGDYRRMWTGRLPYRDPTAARASLAQLEVDAMASRVPAYGPMLGKHPAGAHRASAGLAGSAC